MKEIMPKKDDKKTKKAPAKKIVAKMSNLRNKNF